MDNKYLLISLVCFFSYLIGAIPFGYIIARIVKGIDIREYGSKNIGATNVARVLGRKYFSIIFTLDALKGFAPVFASQFVIEAQTVNVLAGAFAILGHMFPIYLKFKGGKGVATGAGVIFALSWQVGFMATVIWLVAFFASGYVSLASIASALSLPLANIFIDEKLPMTFFFTLVAIIVIIKHSANIKRLANGTESKVLWVKK